MIKLFIMKEVKNKKQVMFNEERYIRDRFGSGNNFRVPEGYFDGFAARLRDKLPEQEAREIPVARPWLARLRPLLCAAACLCLAIFGAAVYFAQTDSSDEAQGSVAVASTQTQYGDTYEDEVLDYAMLDNSDIYAYLAGDQ